MRNLKLSEFQYYAAPTFVRLSLTDIWWALFKTYLLVRFSFEKIRTKFLYGFPSKRRLSCTIFSLKSVRIFRTVLQVKRRQTCIYFFFEKSIRIFFMIFLVRNRQILVSFFFKKIRTDFSYGFHQYKIRTDFRTNSYGKKTLHASAKSFFFGTKYPVFTQHF